MKKRVYLTHQLPKEKKEKKLKELHQTTKKSLALPLSDVG